MCILSLDSSTLPSESMTPGKVSREADRAGELTEATLLLLRQRTSGTRLPGLRSSAAGWRSGSPPWPSRPSMRDENLTYSSLTAFLSLNNTYFPCIILSWVRKNEPQNNQWGKKRSPELLSAPYLPASELGRVRPTFQVEFPSRESKSTVNHLEHTLLPSSGDFKEHQWTCFNSDHKQENIQNSQLLTAYEM